jgi:hypothetical protein
MRQRTSVRRRAPNRPSEASAELFVFTIENYFSPNRTFRCAWHESAILSIEDQISNRFRVNSRHQYPRSMMSAFDPQQTSKQQGAMSADGSGAACRRER